MVYTKQILAFARSTDDEVLDVVKLHEVKCVKDNSARNQTGQMNLAPENSQSFNTNSEDAKKEFQIETTEEGYNAGRIYAIQIKSEKDFRAIIDNLNQLCRTARDKDEAKSKFKRLQYRVSTIFNTNLIQGFFALLIFSVNA
jgi:hypothetical protein